MGEAKRRGTFEERRSKALMGASLRIVADTSNMRPIPPKIVTFKMEEKPEVGTIRRLIDWIKRLVK